MNSHRLNDMPLAFVLVTTTSTWSTWMRSMRVENQYAKHGVEAMANLSHLILRLLHSAISRATVRKVKQTRCRAAQVRSRGG